MKRVLIFTVIFLLMLAPCMVSSATSGDSSDNFKISLSVEPAEGGSVTGAGEYSAGQNVTLTATPNEGYTFTGWYRAENDELVTEETEFEYDLEQDRSYVAKFEAQLSAGIIAEPAEGGSVSQSGSGHYILGDSVTITAVPNEGYTFLGWFDASSLAEPLPADADNPYSYTFEITGASSYIAKFAAQYRLDINVSPEEGGTVLGSGQYAGGSIVTLEAIPAEDYRFVGWVLPSDPSTIISTDTKFTDNLDSDTTYTATFSRSIAYIGVRVAIVVIIGIAAAIGLMVLYKRVKTIHHGSRSYGRGRRPSPPKKQ
ncbi:InlB B-repeat-containing protein [Christensenellaceae bacterium OttesenSCG-928-K19]|nr:InlB B-repeat-containing protein [Christensenellaceae bacterium OttesenSCG-928-K19]